MGTFTALPREAIKGVGGIDYALICNYTDCSTAIDGTSGLASLDPSSGTSPWKKFVPRKESSNFTETMTGTPASGISSFAQVLTLVFAYNQTTKRNQLKVMAQSEMKAIIVDRNGIAWLFGSKNGLDLTSGTAASGVANADANSMTVVLSSNEPEPMAQVPADILAAIQA